MKYYIRITAVLLLVCAIIAGLLAAVNELTKDKIAEYNLEKRDESIEKIFPEVAKVEDNTDGYEEAISLVNKIYNIYSKDGTLLGYCIDATSAKGYSGSINTLVGISEDGEIVGIDVLKHSETKGITKPDAAKAWYDSFIGKMPEDVDNISGATFSSKAIKECVNAGLDWFELKNTNGEASK